MREILFRGRAITGEWLYGSLITYGEKSFIYPVNGSQDDFHFYGYEVIPKTVGQFTGINDVIGVKVFEGDKTSGGVVVYDEYYCSFLIDFPIKNKKMYFEDIMRIFVNGNIHDNHELLNNHKNVR